MNIATHRLEPWLMRHQNVRYNLGQSGVADQTVGEILALAGESPEALGDVSLRDNDTLGSLELRQSVASLYGAVEPDQVLVTTGTSEALLLYFAVRYQPGANVVVPCPAFQSLYEVPRYLGYEVRFLPLRPADGFRPDLDRLSSLVDRHTTAIVVNTPHNPTGIVFDDAELRAITGLAERYGAEVLADEHYRFLPHEGVGLIPSVHGRSPAVVAIGSMIKCLGCVGLRVGWMIGPSELLSACRDFKDYTTHTLCGMSDFIARCVLQRWPELAAKYKGWMVANATELSRMVERHRDVLGFVAPKAGVVAFPGFRVPLHGHSFAESLIEAHGVFVMPGEAFDMPEHFRVGLGLEPAAFAQAMAWTSSFIASRGWARAESVRHARAR